MGWEEKSSSLSNSVTSIIILPWRTKLVIRVTKNLLPSSFLCHFLLVFLPHRFNQFRFRITLFSLNNLPIYLSILKVSVQFSHAYDRIPHSDLTLENTISQVLYSFFSYLNLLLRLFQMFVMPLII
jgi:hypothetical protein